MLCILTCANQLKEDKAKWANSRGVPTNRPGGTLQGAPSRDTAGDQQAAFLTERARCLLCSRPDVFFFFFFFYQSPRALAHHAPWGGEGREGWPETWSCATLLRGLERQGRGGAERASPCPCLLHLRGVAAGQTRGSTTKHSSACDAGHLWGGSQGPAQGTGCLGPPELQPLSQCARGSEISHAGSMAPRARPSWTGCLVPIQQRQGGP